MHWIVITPWIDKSNLKEELWLTDYVDESRHQLEILPRSERLPSWHARKSAVTGFKDWLIYGLQASNALKKTKGGIITLFPQLPAAIGLQRRMMGKRIPIVAWMFNVGTCSDGMRRLFAQASLKDIDRFIVHTRREIEIYHQWLGIPKERFEFIYFHQQEIPVTFQENNTAPFITSLGSAHRDFPTLFQAVEKLDLPTMIASSKRALEGLRIPPQVKAQFAVSRLDCLRLAQEARISIVPMLPNPKVTASGQVTIVEAMAMGRAVIVTDCNGAEDYIQHGKTGLLVKPKSVDDLVQAIDLLWNDSELRNRISKSAQRYAKENFSCEAAGASLSRILDEVADQFGM